MADNRTVRSAVEAARTAYNSGITKPIEFRKKQLHSLVKLLDENEEAFSNALKKDMAKSKFESYLMDIHVTRNEVIAALSKIDKWAKPEKAKTDITGAMSNVYVRKEPFGVCLIMGAWNFPVLLSISPLVGAIAAGNCAVIKPSELAWNTAELLKDLIPKYLHKDCYPVVVTGPEGSASLLEENRFDLIFYTGGYHVGKLVMAAAARNLTPVVLELGGKNPCIIHKKSDLKTVAKRVCFGKFVNAGQICLAPDYVLCEKEIRDEFVDFLKSAVKSFYGDNPKSSDSFSRIINDRHFSRVEKLLKSGKTAIGGQTDSQQKFISPTVLIDVPEDSPVMQEEVFGPILPVIAVKDIDEAVSFVNRREKPLALYVFSKDKKVVRKVIDSTSSGGVTVNDCLMHHNEFQPFGGIGQSGMGNYHGKYSFDTFSHKRACFEQGTPEMLLSVRYPPYVAKSLSRIKQLRKSIPGRRGFTAGFLRFLKLAFLGVVIAYLTQNYTALGYKKD